MGQLKSKILHQAGAENIDNLKEDPDDQWSNLYRERKKNHLYKWNVQLGKTESNFVGQFGSKFREHLGQWRLNKRGVEGETIIHLLLNREEPMCSEIARILITRYPGLANDIYLGDEMFGQSALHLAIVHDDYETVHLLLQNSAEVNARACGTFFLPENQKTSRKSTDYQGYAYYGEYPLAFAACFGNKDIYDLLIQYGADPNLQDMFGNTILHMCVINYSNSMYSYAVRHWAKPADPNIVNAAGLTPLTLATKLGRKDIFEEMLELMKVEFWRFSDMTCSAYPLTALDTIRPDGSTNYDSALMTVINGSTGEHLDMIGSEVIQRLLADKWKAFASRKLFERLGLLILHLIFLCFVVYMRPTDPERLMYKLYATEWNDWVRLFFEILTIASCVFFVFFQQFSELRTQGFYGYIRNLKTAPAKIVFLGANICILICVPFRIMGNVQVEEALLVFSLPGSWIFFLFFARSAKLTGPFVQMIYSMIAGDMIRFAIISAIFLVSFSQVFYFLGKDMHAKQELDPLNPDYCEVKGYDIFTYSSFLETFITLFRASMGGYDYEEFSCANYEVLTKILFVLYMFIMPIMLINILIAMMGNTYTTVIAQAEKAWRQQYAQIVMVLERSVKKEKLAACQLEYSIRLNEANDAGMEIRGLMVIKQTKKTRARQRKQAITNWKTIGRKVIHTVERLGVDYAQELLHSYNCLIDEPASAVILRRDTTVLPPPTRSMTTSQSHETSTNTQIEEKDEQSKNNSDEQPKTKSVEKEVMPNNSSNPTSLQFQSPRDFKLTTTKKSATTILEKLAVRKIVRGHQLVPSLDMPNMPAVGTPPLAVSPRIRKDMFRRKDSFGASSSSASSNTQVRKLDRI
ncbi:transient-receptor-potential calcium channel protein [Onchocerca flexuosa]|uniref:Transient-receptor-potential calcium channel protein n=2 Tax=Onchocerca flexuosa TaxID=387005 RepID=A0A238C0G5_9BILA|nr:transient-receptor-potential calcium channel protein [Onchocerca flexuosa]